MKTSYDKAFLFMKTNMDYGIMIFINVVMAGWALFSKASIAEGMDPYIFGVYRQTFAILALAPFMVFPKRNDAIPPSLRALCKIFLVSFIGITVAFNLTNLAFTYIPGSYLTATGNTIPVFTFLIALAVRVESVSIRKRHGVAKVVGVTLCLCGTLVYVFYRGPPVVSSVSPKQIHGGKSMACQSYKDCVKGCLILVASQVTFALWIVMQGPLVKLYPDKIRLTALQCFFACIQSIVWAVAIERDISAWKLGWDLNLLAVAYSGVIYMALTFWLRVLVIERRGPLFTAVFSPLALIVAVIVSALLWNEIPHWGSVCGALLLIGGLYAVIWGKHIEGQKEPEEQIPVTKPDVPIFVLLQNQIPLDQPRPAAVEPLASVLTSVSALAPSPSDLHLQILSSMQSTRKSKLDDRVEIANCGQNPRPSRWQKPEIEVLTKLRTNLYHDNLPKGPLWEEISARVLRLGHNC